MSRYGNVERFAGVERFETNKEKDLQVSGFPEFWCTTVGTKWGKDRSKKILGVLAVVTASAIVCAARGWADAQPPEGPPIGTDDDWDWPN